MNSLGLRKGYTTGTCAQAAAKAAVIMFTSRELVEWVEVEVPSGIRLNLRITDQEITKDFTSCAVVKDSGDDPDATNRAKIYAEVRLSKEKGVTIKGGNGIGRVTKPGLPVSVGEYAINPIPRKMIIKEVTPYLPKDSGLEVIISVPDGEALAKNTFNPRLGIVGGISIIGTTGIVEPRSTDAYKASLSMQLDVLKAEGYKKATLVFGYVGEKFCKDILNLEPINPVRSKPPQGGCRRADLAGRTSNGVKIGDHVGFMLTECEKKGFKEVFLIGHIGKLIKVSNGQFNTNIKFGDNRIETIVGYAQRDGARGEVIDSLLKQSSAEAAVDILKDNNLEKVFYSIAEDACAKIDKLVNHRLKVNCIILSLKGDILGCHPRDCISLG